MSHFKERVAKDIHRVFLDLNFFGESHVIDGKELIVLFDNDYLSKEQTEGRLGLEEATGLFFAKTEDLPEKKSIRESMEIDGREVLVVEWREDMGVTTVSYKQNRGG